MASARSYVANLVTTKNCQLNPTSQFCTPLPGPTTSTPSTAATVPPTTTKAP